MILRRPRAGLWLGLWLLIPAGWAAAGDVRGTVSLRVEGVRLADVGPVVVFLDGVGGKIPAGALARAASVHQKNATFSPGFLVVAAGQTVDMPNDDVIFHNVFSYSKLNRFDLGLYPRGSSRSVTLRHPGAVRIYCSIHESMNGIIFVSPSPWFDVVRPTGEFAMTGVPAGRYRIRTWSEKLPEASATVSVPAEGSVPANLSISPEGGA